MSNRQTGERIGEWLGYAVIGLIKLAFYVGALPGSGVRCCHD